MIQQQTSASFLLYVGPQYLVYTVAVCSLQGKTQSLTLKSSFYCVVFFHIVLQ